MSYMVMERALSYAIVLDESGRFLKVPNLGYEVGQMLDSVSVFPPLKKKKEAAKTFRHWCMAAACFFLIVLGGWFWQAPMGTVQMQINPNVRMTVNRFDRVVGLDGLNNDGETLIDGYRSYGQFVQAVSNALADRAIEMGYLKDGGQITLTVESTHSDWKTSMEEMLLLELDVHMERRVTIGLSGQEPSPTAPPTQIIIDPNEIITPGSSQDSQPGESPANQIPDTVNADDDGQDDDRNDNVAKPYDDDDVDDGNNDDRSSDDSDDDGGSSPQDDPESENDDELDDDGADDEGDDEAENDN